VRVGIIAPPWAPVPPPKYGGTESVLDGLARGLESAGHEVVLFATGDSTCPVVTSWVHEQAIWLDQANVAAELHQVIAAYDELAECDVVHDHTLAGPLYAARFPDLPVVTTNHGPFDRAAVVLYRTVADRVPVVAISRHQASTGAGVPIARVIHHGVDVAAFPTGTGEGDYAMCLGRMTPDKGIDTAIRAARAAGVPLLIAAKMREDPEVGYFRQCIEPLLGDGIEYVGEVGGVEKLELLGGARCLLNPIRWPEPFGMVMIEALACGTPVITMARGAAPEIVDHGVTGYLCDDDDQLVGALTGMGRIDRSTCRAIAKERFSTDRMVAEHLDLYREVVERPRRAC
jgi:glycosyltransferase involved in cell wall biosynthesis